MHLNFAKKIQNYIQNAKKNQIQKKHSNTKKTYYDLKYKTASILNRRCNASFDQKPCNTRAQENWPPTLLALFYVICRIGP